jgi:hypothetical protein
MSWLDAGPGGWRRVEEEGPSTRRMILAFGWLAAGMVALAVLIRPVDAWQLRIPASGVLGWVVARSAFATFRVAMTYQSGWVDGRNQMTGALRQTRTRGGDMAVALERETALTGLRVQQMWRIPGEDQH